MRNKITVLVLGGTGFIGRNLIEQLSNKYLILAPNKDDLNLLDKNKVDKYFKKNKVSIVIYAVNIGGTRTNQNPENMLRNNLEMFFNVTSNEDFFDRLIFLGSGAEYNKLNKLDKVKESDFGLSIPKDNYGFYKYICSRYIEKSNKIVNLRLFGVFGKYEDYSIRFISNSICKSIAGLPITINQNIVFDYLYIDDLIRIIDYFILNKPNHKFYNVGTGKNIDLQTIARKINKITLSDKPIKTFKKGLGRKYTCNNNQLIKELGGFKFTPLSKSLMILHNYWKTNMHKINRVTLLKKL